jgi:hypothetical protein
MAKNNTAVKNDENIVTETAIETSTATPSTATPAANTLTAEQDASVRGMKTKSEQMRFLSSLGWKNGPIAKFLTEVHGKTVIYQHVRNVLKQPLKSAS